jgi:succinate dehydrogenase flavin-adding protein (antitoxin of CptAB toxin-antitoxin module)
LKFRKGELKNIKGYVIINAVRTTIKHLQPFFWDTDLSKIDMEENKQYIIERILELGDQEAVRWIFSHFSLKEIKKTLEESKRISQKSKNFWFIFLEDHPNA